MRRVELPCLRQRLVNAMAGRQSIEFMNRKRAQMHATSGGIIYARRENAAAATAARQRDANLSDRELELAEAYAGAAETARVLAAELADFRARAGLPPMATSSVTSNVTCCPVCEARRRVTADRVARFRQRKAQTASVDAIPF